MNYYLIRDESFVLDILWQGYAKDRTDALEAWINENELIETDILEEYQLEDIEEALEYFDIEKVK